MFILDLATALIALVISFLGALVLFIGVFSPTSLLINNDMPTEAVIGVSHISWDEQYGKVLNISQNEKYKFETTSIQCVHIYDIEAQEMLGVQLEGNEEVFRIKSKSFKPTHGTYGINVSEITSLAQQYPCQNGYYGMKAKFEQE